MTFYSFFEAATGSQPYPYQEKLARQPEPGQPIRSRLIHVPTGCGKTAAAILAWLWRRKTDPQNTPRRLVYCLPLRVLVEQTREKACEWVSNLKSTIWPEIDVTVNTLMGGEVEEGWELYPEKPAILVGTQDMLLSRALNRGYAMSRYRWPVHFGLFNNDCLWVCDEVQLMGSGLGTTTQLQGLREQFGVFGPSATWWMSATLQTDWLSTVDFDSARLTLVELEHDDLATEEVRKIREARKPLRATDAHIGDPDQLATEIVSAHKKASGRTLVVVNTVTRARELHAAVQRELKAAAFPIEPILIHSRFRPPDRKEHVERLLEEPGEHGMLVISTQVVEAGVDVSARTLFTELAPWSSLVQRFGRCNRRGSDNYTAQAFWIDLPENENQQEKVSNPYELVDLKRSRELLRTCNDVSPASLEAICFTQPFQHTHVIRRHDLYGLFSTEPDLAGGFTDISAFVRDLDKDADVYVFWRDFAAKPQEDQPQPSRDELCHVPVWQLRDFLGKKGSAWEWDGENEGWSPRSARDIRPGMTLMLNFTQGGYAEDFGWTGRSEDKPEVLAPSPDKPDALNRDRQSETDWLSLADHLLDAEAAARTIADSLEWDRLPKDALVKAARWHDVGKLHGKWQDSVETYIKRVRDKIATYSATDLDGPVAVLLRSLEERCALPTTAEKPWAKFPDVRKAIRCSGLDDAIQAALTEALSGQFRPALRHEAASALAAWQHWRRKSDGWTALAIYLVAAHHGKVRTVLRSRLKGGGDVFGIRQGDKLPPLPGWLTETMPLVLECKAFGGTGEWGESGETFDLREPSWVGVVAELLGPEFPSDPLPSVLSEAESKHLGPLRLVFLEALTVAADVRASRQPGSGRNLCQKS